MPDRQFATAALKLLSPSRSPSKPTTAPLKEPEANSPAHMNRLSNAPSRAACCTSRIPANQAGRGRNPPPQTRPREGEDPATADHHRGFARRRHLAAARRRGEEVWWAAAGYGSSVSPPWERRGRESVWRLIHFFFEGKAFMASFIKLNNAYIIR